MDAAERTESFNVSPILRLPSPSRFRGRLSDEIVGQLALLDEDGGRFREALQHDDALVPDDALHAVDGPVFADQLIALLRDVVRARVRHLAILYPPTHEFLQRGHDSGPPLRERHNRAQVT